VFDLVELPRLTFSVTYHVADRARGVRLIHQGVGNKDIAARLFVTPRTMQTHHTHVYTNLDLTSRTQLIRESRSPRGWRRIEFNLRTNVLMPSTPFAYPQVVSRTFASFHVPKSDLCAAQ